MFLRMGGVLAEGPNVKQWPDLALLKPQIMSLLTGFAPSDEWGLS